MKRFARRQEDVHQARPPKLSEIVKAIEDAWSEYPDAPIAIKNGDIRVRYSGERSASYRCEPKLQFSDGLCYWIVESWGAPGGRDKVVVGAKMPSPVSTCTVPHMGDFHGRPEDIRMLEAAADEVRKAYAKVQDLLNSEVEQ
jgi:hypothetical protein